MIIIWFGLLVKVFLMVKITSGETHYLMTIFLTSGGKMVRNQYLKKPISKAHKYSSTTIDLFFLI